MKRIIYQLIAPVALLILSAIIIVRWPELASYMNREENLQALLILLPALPYVLFFILISIGWRFNNAGLIVSSLLLSCSYFIFTFYSARTQDILMVTLIFFCYRLT